MSPQWTPEVTDIPDVSPEGAGENTESDMQLTIQSAGESTLSLTNMNPIGATEHRDLGDLTIKGATENVVIPNLTVEGVSNKRFIIFFENCFRVCSDCLKVAYCKRLAVSNFCL